MARRGVSMFGSASDAFTPMLWIADAATAMLAALERAPSGLYDAVDDEPLRQRQIKQALAAAVGGRRLISLPTWLVRLMAGPTGAALTRSLRISNRRFRDAAGWAPAVRNAAEGLDLVASASALSGRQHVPAVVRVGLVLMALFTLLTGIQQQFAPGSFYDNFPGFGMRWVSVDGPYNEHLLRDLGGVNLGLAVLVLFAIARPAAGLIRAVAVAMLIAQVPHFIYHAAHLDLLPTTLDRLLQTAALTLAVFVPLIVLIGAKGSGQVRKALSPQPTGADANKDAPRPCLIASTR
ncbi:MAG: hypothetical protein KY456_13030 [Chloroflexi bacterium]|nr:hypothetical protein [Chloroflexota bacterium]